MRAGSSYTSLAHMLSRCASPRETLQPPLTCLCSGELPLRAAPWLSPVLPPFAVWLWWLQSAVLPFVMLPLCLGWLSPLPLGWLLVPLLTLLDVLVLNGNALASHGSENRGSARLMIDTGVPGATGALRQKSPTLSL